MFSFLGVELVCKAQMQYSSSSSERGIVPHFPLWEKKTFLNFIFFVRGLFIYLFLGRPMICVF